MSPDMLVKLMVTCFALCLVSLLAGLLAVVGNSWRTASCFGILAAVNAVLFIGFGLSAVWLS